MDHQQHYEASKNSMHLIEHLLWSEHMLFSCINSYNSQKTPND